MSLRCLRSTLAVIMGAPFLALPAFAQTASELTPETFQPAPQRLGGAVVFSGQPGLEAPAGSERLTVAIADVAVDGTLTGLEAATAALRTRLTEGRVRVSEIFEAAADLEAAYAEAGFILARVVLPAQRLTDGGRLRLVIVDGFVEDIDDTAVPDPVRGRIATLADPLIGRRGVTLRELERQLLLAGDTYGVALGSALATGGQPGGTVIVLDPQYRPVTGFIGFDNSNGDALGTFTIDAGVELNGLLGQGESLYARISGAPFADGANGDGFFGDNPRLRTLAVGAVVPLGGSGLSFNLEATSSRATPDTAGVPNTSTFERVSLRLFYPWVRSRQTNISSQLSLDFQTDSADLISAGGNTPFFADRQTILRFGTNAAWVQDSGAVLEAGGQLSLGLDLFDAKTQADAAASGIPLSRAGADAEFGKLELSARYRTALGESLSLSLGGRVQSSFGDPLTKAEQMGITTPQDISTVDAGGLSGDSGWVVRGELAYPVQTQLANRPVFVSPYLFGAAGEVYREAPTVDETAATFASAFGIGVDIGIVRDPAFSSGSLRLELGRGNRDDGPDDTRFSIVGSLRF